MSAWEKRKSYYNNCVCIKGEEFTEELVKKVSQKKLEDFVNKERLLQEDTRTLEELRETAKKTKE